MIGGVSSPFLMVIAAGCLLRVTLTVELLGKPDGT
jgi:hypothetical protein